MSQSSSTKSPPRLSSLSHLQRSSPDEDVEGLGPGAIAISTPSNNSSFSSAGSPSDRTSVTNVESPSPRHHDTKSSSSAPWPADLLESLTQTISVLWQIRAVGPVNYHLLGHLDRFVRRDPPRIELPLGRVDYASLSRLLRLGALTGIADPGHDRDSRREVWQHEAEQQQGTAGRDETPQDKSLGKPLSRQTNALQSAASSIIWALRNTCSSGVRTQDLDLDAEGGSPGISLSPQALLERLGRWVLEKLRIEYDYEEAVFTVRMPSVFHDKSSHSIAECLLLQIRRAVGDTSIEAPRFTACSLPLILTAENIQADVSDDEIGAVAVAPKRSHYHPDAGIFDGASLQPGLILELGWSHPTHRKRAKSKSSTSAGDKWLISTGRVHPKRRWPYPLRPASQHRLPRAQGPSAAGPPRSSGHLSDRISNRRRRALVGSQAVHRQLGSPGSVCSR